MAVDRDFEQSIYNHQQEQAAPGSLFETYADHVLRHVDDLLAGRSCPWPLDPHHRALLNNLRWHSGRSRALPLTQLAAALDLDDRKVKSLVEDLRLNFRVQIGAARSHGGGYYLIATEEESLESYNYLLRQAVSMLRTARVLRPSHTIAELAGQVRLALESPSFKSPTSTEKEISHV